VVVIPPQINKFYIGPGDGPQLFRIRDQTGIRCSRSLAAIDSARSRVGGLDEYVNACKEAMEAGVRNSGSPIAKCRGCGRRHHDRASSLADPFFRRRRRQARQRRDLACPMDGYEPALDDRDVATEDANQGGARSSAEKGVLDGADMAPARVFAWLVERSGVEDYWVKQLLLGKDSAPSTSLWE